MQFSCNGEQYEVDADPGESLLSVLRERLGVVSPKDGCAPQGQCGCCTVLVDGEPRVACVTPMARVAGRAVTTVEGLDPAVRDDLAARFVATGGSQCGFCTPGILMRLAAAEQKGKTAAHRPRPHPRRPPLSLHRLAVGVRRRSDGRVEGRASVDLRDVDAAAQRAELEGGAQQSVGLLVPLGDGGFADDGAPRDALVAVPAPPGATADVVDAAGMSWVVADSLLEARALAGKVQGRRTTVEPAPPLPLPAPVDGGVRLTTSWVEPALPRARRLVVRAGGEPGDAARERWCVRREGHVAGRRSRPRARRPDRSRRARRVLPREDVVRLGPKRPPIAATASFDGTTVHVQGAVLGDPAPFTAPIDWPYALTEHGDWTRAAAPGPTTASTLRAVGLAERAVLLEGALRAAGADRVALAPGRARRVGGARHLRRRRERRAARRRTRRRR